MSLFTQDIQRSIMMQHREAVRVRELRQTLDLQAVPLEGRSVKVDKDFFDLVVKWLPGDTPRFMGFELTK